ncbi:MAG: biotin--[acetyl-CoA-carboxylase] ligase [Desulfamplus sp.]|nr:biotin--[acetyl-CoA-carboxylase] ligase [Desulfamplus sp.]
MKEKIIEILNNTSSGEPISGVEMSNQLGISRVAIWKHLKQLKECGYSILSTPKGYKLKADRDLMMPFFFTKRKEKIHFFQTISSTMDKARELAICGVPGFSVVVAEEQTKGRGRLNRTWNSGKGGLWFTLILRPKLPPPFAFQVNFAASLSLARTLRQKYELDVSVKWPNDILIKEENKNHAGLNHAGLKNSKIVDSINCDHDNRSCLNGQKKLAGLLSEMETQGDMISFVNIGIGLNVNNNPQIDEPNSVSIKNILGQSICRRELLSAFLDDFENQLIAIESSENSFVRILDEWKQMTSTIGRDVRIETFGDIYRGKAIDVDRTGALIIRQEDGHEKNIIYGDCFYDQKGLK